jgi:hypothetical protein
MPGTSATIYARYTGSNYNSSTNIWVDSTGNGRDIPSSRITSTGLSLVTTTANTNGSTNSFTTLQGTVNSYISLTTSTLTNYTLFTVARYVGTNNKRIFNGSNENWLSGFWNGYSGVCFHYTVNFLTQNTSSQFGNNWVISTDSSALYRGNGTNLTINAVGDTYLPPISIGPQTPVNGSASEPSDFQVADILIYNSYLSNADILIVERYLSNLYGIAIP